MPLNDNDIHINSDKSLDRHDNFFLYRMDDQIVLFEYTEIRPYHATKEAVEDMRKLVAVLCNVDAEIMHILCCVGVKNDPKQQLPSLVYRIPTPPMRDATWTLESALKYRMYTSQKALEMRVRYAVEIAEGIMYTHAAGLVHKALNPKSILCASSHDLCLLKFKLTGESRDFKSATFRRL